MYDCRTRLNGQILRLRDTYDVDASFLNPEGSLNRFAAGDSVTLWEGRTIAMGKVLRVQQ